MAIKLLKNADGSFRRVWYGRLTRNGRKVDVKLDVGPIQGEIPTTPDGQWDRNARGDAKFEKSRAEAEKAFDALVKGDGKRRRSLERLENERRALTGQGFKRTPLSSLYSKWLERERGREPTEIRKGIAKNTFLSFASFAETYSRKKGKICSALEDVTVEMANAYLKKLKAQYAWETAKGRFSIMRTTWRRLATTRDAPNPFEDAILKGGGDNERKRIPRVPLTLTQLNRLFDIVKEKRLSLYPLLACVATTGLRLGDAVSLKWSDVKLNRSMAARKKHIFGTIGIHDGVEDGLETSKTRARVILKILEPFASVLLDMDARRDDRDEYLFPRERERYAKPSLRSGLIREIKPFFALAVSEDAVRGEAEEPEDVREPKTLDETLALIEAAGFAPSKANRLRSVAWQRLGGFNAETIAKNLATSPAQISADLRTLEELTGDTLRTGGRKSELGTSRRDLIKLTRRGGAKGRRAASIFGWHSLRATFVVLAVEAGVSLAEVQKAVGHATTKQTLEYYNPTREHYAEIIGTRLGALLEQSLATSGEIVEAEPPPALPAPSLDEQIDALPEEAKKALARRLLGL